RILLDQFRESGRYYIDLEDIIKDEISPPEKLTGAANPYQPIEPVQIKNAIALYLNRSTYHNTGYSIGDSHLERIIDAAITAPSAGNNQPWKWVYNNGLLFLFHDKFKSWSWGDYYEMGSHMALGAALENVTIQAVALGIEAIIERMPLKNIPELIAVVQFKKSASPVGPQALKVPKQFIADLPIANLATAKNSIPVFLKV
ncbi:MAG: nitroreductase family protein, partial [Bacteroidota bacterium]|nr:nitroreductase family protein [Bacteroidota bacterium]